MPAGEVIFIGAGPGAADLITLRGARALGRATLVLADALSGPALREFAPQAQWLDVGKRGFCHATAQDRINALLVQHARAGHIVARLKGGDPSVFGRLEEEQQALLQAAVAYQVIPGVSSVLAAAADSRRPLTRRGAGRSLALHTAMTRDGPPGQHAAERQHADTEVFYMAGQQLARLGERLRQAGWPADAPVHVASRAGWPDSLGTDHHLESLHEAAARHAGRPTVVVVGAGAVPVDANPGGGNGLEIHQAGACEAP